MMQQVEEKRNKLNLQIRELLSIIDMIDGKKEEYVNYKKNTMNEEEFLDSQMKLIDVAKTRMIDIFRD